jgi:hypothetical protein
MNSYTVILEIKKNSGIIQRAWQGKAESSKEARKMAEAKNPGFKAINVIDHSKR